MLLDVIAPYSGAATAILIAVAGGVFSLTGVYISLKLSINTLETKQLEDEKQIIELKQLLQKTNDTLNNNISEIKEMLTTIKVDIEKIRP